MKATIGKGATPLYDIRSEVNNYMGYWPSSSSVTDDFAYTYGFTAGNYIEFPVALEDVVSVTGLQIFLADGSDDLRLESVSVELLSKIGRRRIYAQDLSSQSGTSPYRIVRTLEKTVLPPYPLNIAKYFSPGDDYKYVSGTGVVVPSDDIDCNSMRYSMTYEQTQKNLGFAKIKKTYDVNVKVADDSAANNINGDSGSKNLFYFQLRFANGTSAFVLANQQLAADAFRAGYDETFAISVNRDYGALTAVRIIPDSATEDGELFDKLNIEEITVTERTNGGSGMQYVISSVGWIDIDYHDSAIDSSLEGRDGKKLNELASTFPVSYQQKIVNLLCEVATLPWDVEYIPIEASISCDLVYIDTNGQARTKSFDVIGRMYDYMKKSAKSYEMSADGSNASLYVNMGSISDPNSMLRPNHTDRFVLPPLADAKSLKSMTFYATSRGKGTGYWVIGGLSISSIISDSGNLDLNANGEYYRGMITEPLCQMITAEKEKTLTMPTGQTQHMTFDLTDNEIEWDENSSWVSSVTRLPDSTNDTLNIFIFPSADSRNIAGVVVGVAAQYSLPSSKAMQVNQNSMNVYGSGTSDAVFYYTGLPANNMQNLTDLKVRCRNAGILFDHALVQQVRDGVVVANYSVFLGGASAQLGLRAAPQSETTVSDPTCQKMLLSFGTDTKEMTLFNSDTNVNDIAVSVKYKSTLDHGLNDYYSPYVYLTDVGIGKISPGMMAEIPLEIPYLSEVTEYRIVSFGNITANVDAALITNYTYSSKNIDSNGKTDHVGLNQTGCYSFARSYAVTNQITPCSRTSANITGNGIVELVDLAFTTAEAEAGMASGTDSPVQMIVTYSDSSAAVHSRLFDDIREYIQISDEQTRTEAEVDSKQFKAGKISRVRFFLPNCENIESIRLIPKNDEGTASWRLAKIEGSLMFGNVDLDRVIGQQITQSENGIEIKYTNVSMRTYVYTGDKGEWVFDHSHGTVVESEKSAVIMVYVDDGFDVKAVWNVEGQPDVSDTTLFNITSDSVTFVAPKNSSSTVQTYQITITSRKNNAYKDVITVSVPVPEPEKIEPATHEAGSSDSNTQENETESVQQSAENTTSPQEENTNSSEETTDSADSTQNEEQ